MALDYGWFYPVARVLRAQDGQLRVPPPSALIEGTAGSLPLGDLASSFFGVDLHTGATHPVSGWPPTPTDSGLLEALRASAEQAQEQGWLVAVVVSESGPGSPA